MHFDEPRFFRLLNKQRLGKLNAEEERYMLEMLREHEEARNLQKDFQDSCSLEDFTSYLNEHDPQTEVDAIFKIASTKKRRKRLQIVSTLACLLLIVTAVVYFLLPRKPKEIDDNKAVILELSNGKKFALPKIPAMIETEIGDLSADSASLKIVNSAGVGKAGLNTLLVPNGRKYMLTLSDKTVVYLNAGSRINFPFKFSGKQREINIRGEAYIKVEPFANRPFVVHTSLGMIEVLGTEFNVNSYDSVAIHVALTRGSVRVRTQNEQVVIQPGEEAIMSQDRTITVVPFDNAVALGWLKGDYVFTDERLENIMNAVERRFGVTVIYKEPRTAKQYISGVITDNMTLIQLINHLNTTCSVRVSLTNDTLLIDQNK